MTEYTRDNPLRLVVSACLAGIPCGVDGTSYGEARWIKEIIALPNVDVLRFCPEDFSFGTPRAMPDIHGGNGFDVLDGKARVLSAHGADWTDGMIAAAHEMLRRTTAHGAKVAIMMDMSAACGSQVISLGCRLDETRVYQKGAGVAAALLMRNGIRVIAQRDFRALGGLRQMLEPNYRPDPNARDHHETDWYCSYFKVQSPSFRVRPMASLDVTAVGAIIAKVKRAEFCAELAFEDLAKREATELSAAAADARSRFFVLESTAGVVGGAGLVPLAPDDANTAVLRTIFLLPEARGQGGGRALAMHCLEAARALGFRQCYLETLQRMEAARALYHALGFTPLRRPLGPVPSYVDCWMMAQL